MTIILLIWTNQKEVFYPPITAHLDQSQGLVHTATNGEVIDGHLPEQRTTLT